LPVIITRGNNVYGPRQYPEKLIPKLICRLERGLTCCLHGDGSHKRSYLYIDDVVKAFDIILHKARIGEIYNIGTSFEISNYQVARTLLKKFGYQNQEDQHIEYCEDRPFNDLRYSIDPQKLHNLGWRPVIDFEEGLNRTIEWYKTNFHNWENVEIALVPHPIPPHSINSIE